jgi:hypothetical protein
MTKALNQHALNGRTPPTTCRHQDGEAPRLTSDLEILELLWLGGFGRTLGGSGKTEQRPPAFHRPRLSEAMIAQGLDREVGWPISELLPPAIYRRPHPSSAATKMDYYCVTLGRSYGKKAAADFGIPSAEELYIGVNLSSNDRNRGASHRLNLGWASNFQGKLT